MRNLDIAEVAARSGVPASTLRYYEEQGLIRSVGRRGLRRVFAADVIERLALIALGRATGFSLEEMAGMFTRDGRVKIDRDQLAAKAKELDATIKQLTAMRDGLKHAAACQAPSHMECPKFQRIVKAAAAGALGARPKRARPGAGRLSAVTPRGVAKQLSNRPRVARRQTSAR